AEMERAQAQVKVQEERKRRRLTLALASSLLLLVVGGSIGGVWYQLHRIEQRAKVEGDVRTALNEAALLGDRARTLGQNPLSWKTTLEAALSAARRAEDRLAGQPELAEGELAEQVRQVKVRLEADEKDRLLLAAFDKVREEQSEPDPRTRALKLR